MATSRNKQENIDHYLNILCPLSNKIYGHFVFVTLSEKFAQDAVHYAFEQSADQVNESPKDDMYELYLYKKCWHFIEKEHSRKIDKNKIPKEFHSFVGSEMLDRAIFIAIDLLGMKLNDAKDLFVLNEGEIEAKIISFRKMICDLEKS